MFSRTAARETPFGVSVSPKGPGVAANLVRALFRRWSQWRTARILHGLDDAGLKDIGLQRGMIDSAFHDNRYSPRF